MMYRWLILLIALLPLSAWAGVQATLDRNDVHLGETVTLNLQLDGSMSASQPDLSALNNDFEVLGTSTNSMLTVENGQQTMRLIVGIALRPKHVGDLRVPPLSIGGGQTSALMLHVSAPDTSSTTAGNTGKNVFLETQAASNHVYAGQQLLFTVRLFYAVNLNGGSLGEPHADDVDVRKLGGDADYETDRNGRHYHVVERRYALVPHHAGSVTIPSLEFQGEAVQPVDPNDPASFFGRGGMFGSASPVTADSAPVTLQVQGPPDDWGNTAWLPARSLSLQLDGYPADDKIHVGEPLSLHMTVRAQGISGEALPELSLPPISGATVYPDPSSTSTKDDGQWLNAQRSRSFAVFPQAPGSLTIPATTLTWFNTQTGKKEVASIPAHTVTVLPALNAAPATATSAAKPAATPAVASSTTAGATAMTLEQLPWRWIALGLLVLWLLSMLLMALFWRRKRSDGERPARRVEPVVGAGDTGDARAAFMQAAQARDASAQARHLLRWARTERPALQNLGELSQALGSATQRATIERLQRAQFAQPREGEGIDASRAFANGFEWRKDGPVNPDSLPPLYPFKLD